MRMLKRVFVLFALLLLCGAASASVHVLSPVDLIVPDGGTVSLGSIARGETVDIIIDKKAGAEVAFDRINIETDLPKGWAFSPKVEDRTLVVTVSVSNNAEEATQNIPIKIWNSASPEKSNQIAAMLYVKKNLITVDVKELAKETIVGEAVNYDFILINDSVASHRVIITSDMPVYWFETMEITLKPKQKTEISIPLTPHAYGVRDFTIQARSLQNDTKYLFNARVYAKTTLGGKFRAPMYGFPFFSLSLSPQLLLNAFISWIS